MQDANPDTNALLRSSNRWEELVVMAFSDRLAELRRERQLTQKALAIAAYEKAIALSGTDGIAVEPAREAIQRLRGRRAE